VERDRSIRLDLDADVYSPAEDTFLMLSALEIRKGERALEMGCGSGYIALHMAKAGASVTAVDVDPLAAENTRKNAELNHLEIVVLVSDLFQNVPGTYDLLVFNPPYLRGNADGQEDLCWAGGEDGVTITARFLQEAKGRLATGGRTIIIVSSDCDGEAMERALLGWRRRKLASQNLFFERLDVLELKL
jgi:release factor glutamine methyltransferase